MATWEDGPEYAPRERPSSFAEPTVAPLEPVPAAAQPAANAPATRPQFGQPAAPVAPLAELVPAPADVRDPHRPFDVAASALTSDSAWGSLHWSAPHPVGSGPAVPVAVGPTAAGPAPMAGPIPAPQPGSWSSTPGWPAPEQPLQVQQPGPGTPGGYPAPGTPGWFAPPPPYGEQPSGGRVDAKRVVEAATPGLCICLAIGGLIYVLAPIMVVVAVALSGRVSVGQPTVRYAFRAAAGLVGLIALGGLVSDAALATGWWSFVGLWSLLVCWAMLVVLLALVWRALRRPAAPPGRSPWG
jgi:hypothetical protein